MRRRTRATVSLKAKVIAIHNEGETAIVKVLSGAKEFAEIKNYGYPIGSVVNITVTDLIDHVA